MPDRPAGELRRTGSIVALTVLIAAATFAGWLLLIRHTGPLSPRHSLSWVLLAAGFTLGRFASIRVEFRDNGAASSLADAVLLPAIAFSGGSDVLLAALVGMAIFTVAHRLRLIKASFNWAVRGASVLVGILCYHGVIGTALLTSPRGWVAAASAAAACEIVSLACFQCVIALTAGRVARSNVRQLVRVTAYTISIDFALGLTAVYLWVTTGGLVLFAAVAFAFAIDYRKHGRLRRRHQRLEQLYHFEQSLGGIVETDAVISAVLEEALALLNAEVAELVVRYEGETVRHSLRAGGGSPVRSIGEHAIADLVGGSAGLIAARGALTAELSAALESCGYRDAVAIHLPSDVTGADEVLVVANRFGDQITFTPDDMVLAETLATPTAMALRSSDLLEKLRAELAQKAYQASHDVLTGLANRRLFETEVNEALADRADDALVGIMVIDLDGFKSLNDTFGHEAGDVFLQKLADNFRRVVGDRGIVGRFGGDEFAVVIPKATDTTEIAAIAHELNLAARRPIQITSEASDQRGASIGVAVAPMHGENRYTLMRDADLAMYRAKQHGGGVAYHDDHEDQNIDRPTLIAALREAIHTSSLSLHYQPKVYFDSPGVAGVEALLRWTHPRYGVIPPDEFIEAAEASGLIRPLTRWVLASALAQCSLWHASGFPLNVAVNLSPLQINDPDIVTHVKQLLEMHKLAPQYLTLEITESFVPIEHSKDGRHVLGSLQRLGVRLSIDDYGTGTSSLASVKQLPVTEVKIDKSFITHITRSQTDRKMVASTIALLHDLGLVVVAEGIETEDAYRQLRSLNCDIAQGYLVSKPKSPEDLEPWLTKQFFGVTEEPSLN